MYQFNNESINKLSFATDISKDKILKIIDNANISSYTDSDIEKIISKLSDEEKQLIFEIIKKVK